MQIKNLLKKNSIALTDGKNEVIKVVGTPFKLLTGIWCRHEAECLLRLAELGFANAPKLISSTSNSFTMEKIEGTSLGDRQFLDEDLFLRIMNVVRELHVLGFAHGNLRPNNIIITDRGEPVLIDFETCCQIRNPLFFLVKFSDYVSLHLLWKSRVVQINQDIGRIVFPGYVTLAMFIITPFNRFSGFFKTIKKKLRRSLSVSTEQRGASSGSESRDASSKTNSRLVA